MNISFIRLIQSHMIHLGRCGGGLEHGWINALRCQLQIYSQEGGFSGPDSLSLTIVCVFRLPAVRRPEIRRLERVKQTLFIHLSDQPLDSFQGQRMGLLPRPSPRSPTHVRRQRSILDIAGGSQWSDGSSIYPYPQKIQRFLSGP